jgi:hypothetical protein
MHKIYRHNDDSVSHQTVDQEVILIHFETGHYFSLQGSAADLWHALATPADAGALAGMFRGGAPEEVIQDFLEALESDGLLTEAPATDVLSAPPALDHAFVTPHIERHTDLEAILMADPIHEVEDQGWPSTLKA